jgi:hypothetical protein
MLGKKSFTSFSRSNKKSIQLDRDQQTLDAFVRKLRKVTRNFLHVWPSVCPFTRKRANNTGWIFLKFHFGIIINFVETYGFLLKIWQNDSHLTWSVIITGIRNTEIVFHLLYELTLKKHLSQKHRAWSIVNVDYRFVRDIDCKTLRLGGTVYGKWQIGCFAWKLKSDVSKYFFCFSEN